MQEAASVRSIAELAAACLLSLTDATAATACVTGDSEHVFATAGHISMQKAEERIAALAKLADTGERTATTLGGEPGTLAVSFYADGVRGALLAEGPGLLFGEAETRLATNLAAQLGARSASILMADRLRLLQQMQRALIDAVAEGVLLIGDRRIAALNHAGAQLLGLGPADAIGQPVKAFWPDLARAMESGQPLEEERIQLTSRDLSVTLRTFPDGPWATSAVATFTPAPATHAPAPGSKSPFASMVGVSNAIKQVRGIGELAAQSSSGVLIEGESGVGKEVLAQAIHAAGPRCRQPFVGVLCAAIPRELLESELFGYEAGSFTGASSRGHAGKFELANGGTLLLDDIVDMPLDMQAKLLRVLQERAVTRLGGSHPHPIDVRIIATANRTVADAVRSGLFRADLYYRVNVLNIAIPPLARRREDVRPLAEHFLRKHAAAHHSALSSIGAEAARELEAYPWPGNARELEHWIESEVHFAPQGETCLRRLTRAPVVVAPETVKSPRKLEDLERELFATALVDAAGDISRAARALGISRGRLYRKLRLYDVLPK
jgi:transcriptional regulator with PAS, ATPase and Fis domain